MSYDHWKTTEPQYGYDDDRQLWGDCDCCSKNRPLSRCWASGIETFACDECRGIEPDEDDDQGRYEHETGVRS